MQVLSDLLPVLCKKMMHADWIIITLEALRERAVRKVQEGESPEVVARVLGLNWSTVYGWLAQYRRGGLGAPSRRSLCSGVRRNWMGGL